MSAVEAVEVEQFEEAPAASKKSRWAGYVLSAFGVLFLAFDATFKFVAHPEAIKSTTDLGWNASALPGIGTLQWILLVVYLVPRTSVLGAILWTGYLGGAIATHVRIGNPLFSHVLFPTYIAAFLWLGLWLREPRLRALVPFRLSK